MLERSDKTEIERKLVFRIDQARIGTLTVTPEESGRVLGANDLIQAITGSVGVAIFGQMMSAGVMSGGSIAGTEAGAASTYANVFLIGGVIVLSALVIFILTKKMIYSRSRKDEE